VKIIKILCDVCHAKIATWDYIPDCYDGKHFYCEDCVPRGCSCNIKDYPLNDPNEPGIEETDELGRLLPCCEFDYSLNGWTPTHLLNGKWINKYRIKSRFKYIILY
jgi:hypothetical protein